MKKNNIVSGGQIFFSWPIWNEEFAKQRYKRTSWQKLPLHTIPQSGIALRLSCPFLERNFAGLLFSKA